MLLKTLFLVLVLLLFDILLYQILIYVYFFIEIYVRTKFFSIVSINDLQIYN